MATEKSKLSSHDFEAGLQDLDGSSEYKNILIYGDSGIGKTHLIGTLPGRLLILAGEPGYISAANAGAVGKVRQVPDPATALAAIEWLENGGATKFDWVVLDGINTIQNKFLLAYCAEAFDSNPAKRTHRNLPDKPDYFNSQNMIKSLTARFVDLPVNTLYTTHAMRPEDDDGDLLVCPAIQGKKYEVSNFISGLMHVVGFYSMRVQKTESGPEQVRRLLFRHLKDPKTDTTYFAKDQFGKLPAYVDNPNFSDLLMTIDGEIVPDEPTVKRPKQSRVRPTVSTK